MFREHFSVAAFYSNLFYWSGTSIACVRQHLEHPGRSRGAGASQSIPAYSLGAPAPGACPGRSGSPGSPAGSGGRCSR